MSLAWPRMRATKYSSVKMFNVLELLDEISVGLIVSDSHADTF